MHPLAENTYDALIAEERAENDLLYADSDTTSALESGMSDESFWIRHVGDIRGKQVLEVGSGDGRRAVWLASMGAVVHAVDLSPVGASKTLERARHFGLQDRVKTYSLDACHLESVLPRDSIDVVVGFSVLHHLSPQEFGKSLRAILTIGGRAVFCENSAANPLYRFGRRIRNGETACGSPLSVNEAQELISAVGTGECVYPKFALFGLMKKYIWRRSRWFATIVDSIDTLIDHIPGSKRWSAHMWVVARRSA
jgi:SAM-dependent methyltransferase